MRLLDCCKKSGRKVEPYEGEKSYIATGDVDIDKIVSYTNVRYEDKPSRANVYMDNEQILFAKMMATNKVLIGDSSNISNIYSTGFYCLEVNKGIIVPKLLYHYIKSDLFNKQKDKYCDGATMKALNDHGLSKITISVPELLNQEKLLKVLDDIDKIIEINKNNIRDNKLLIKSKYSELFENYENKITIGEACTVKARIGWQGLTKKEYLTEGDYHLVTGVDFKDDKIDFDNCVFVTKERYDQDVNIQLKNGDVLVTKDGTIGKVAIVENLKLPATLNSGVFVVRDKTGKLNNRFIEYSLLSHKFIKFIDAIKTGATISHLNQAAFVKFEIPYPSTEEQEYFLKFVNYVNKLNDINKENIADLIKLKEIIIRKNFS